MKTSEAGGRARSGIAGWIKQLCEKNQQKSRAQGSSIHPDVQQTGRSFN